MGKRHAQRQKEYRERLKSKNREEYLRKDRERKKRQRELLKNSEEKYEMYKLKERKREKTKKQNMTLSDPATLLQQNKHLEKLQQELRKIYLKGQEEKEKLYLSFFIFKK